LPFSYEGELDIDNKLNNFLKIIDILNNVFRPQKKRLRKLEQNYTIHWPFQYCYTAAKLGTIKASDARRIRATEMKYMRRTAGYTWTDYKTNAQNTKELKITPFLYKLLEYTRSWIQHVNRMPRNRLPRVMKHYSPNGRRNHGRSLKRFLDT